jgi:protein-S-isoprenylcysteine O-methyltransferase Ste14
MRHLELKIPPPIVGLVVGVAMWGTSRSLSGFAFAARGDLLPGAVLLAALGLACAASGAVSFRRARTTISPIKPEAASALVTRGIYARTRNPMYLGMLLVLAGWALYLACAPAALGPLAFFFYITRFQIIPEERVLTGLFGGAFVDYCRQVRRWA